MGETDYADQTTTPSRLVIDYLKMERHAEINSPGVCTECLKADVFIAMRRVSPSTLICDVCGATRSAE